LPGIGRDRWRRFESRWGYISTHASPFDELRSGCLDLRIAPVRKAQHEPAAVAPANAQARQRYEALPVESRRQFDIVEASLTEQREVQPGLRGSKPKSQTQRRAKSVDQDRTAAIVHCIHAPDMSRIVTLLDKIRECKELKASAGGIPVAFVNAEVIHGLLMERRRLKRDASAPPQVFSVSIGGYWFVERSSFNQLVSTTFQLMAAKMNRQTAERIVSALKDQGHEVVKIHPYPGGGSRSSSFEQLMNLPQVEADIIVGEAEPQ